MSTHILSVLVENKPGVLARVSALFSQRGYNINSIAAGETEHPDISRMTVLVDVEEGGQTLEQVVKQLNKLVEVIKVVELEDASAVARRILLVKIRTRPETRTAVLETAQLFRARVVDVSGESVTIEATGRLAKLEALVELLEPYGVTELVQSGMVAIGRGPRSLTDRSRT